MDNKVHGYGTAIKRAEPPLLNNAAVFVANCWNLAVEKYPGWCVERSSMVAFAPDAAIPSARFRRRDTRLATGRLN